MTLEAERDAILALARDDDEDHWQIGVHYNNIVDHKLAEQNGYQSAREFFAREIKAIPQSTLSLYGSVARAYSEEHARKYGVSNLGRLLTYSALIHAPPTLQPEKIQVFVPQKDGSIKMKFFPECSRAELAAAIKRLKKGPTHQVPPEDLRRVKALQSAVDHALGEHSHVLVTARMHGNRTVINLENIPLAELASVIDALRGG